MDDNEQKLKDIPEYVTHKISDVEKSLSIIHSILDSTADSILAIDLHGKIEFFNKNFLNMFNLTEKFIVSSTLDELIQEIKKLIIYPDEFIRSIKKPSVNYQDETAYEIRLKNGNIFEWYSKPHRLINKTVGRIFCFRDITARKQIAQRLVYQATHDALTELPNRTLLFDRLNQGIAFAKRYNSNLVTLFVDIDNFKLINDSLGHDAGDILLQKIAKRLTLFTREGDTIARFSGDEFVIIFITNSTCNVVLLAQKILDKISKPVQIKNQEIVVTASVGVSAYPKDGEDATTLLKNADMAMHLAKDQGRNNFKLYDETIHQQAQNNLEMQIQLRNAIVCNEFMLLYQPTIDLKTNLIIGVEALVRWNHPKRGIIHPAEFIPIAEQSNIMVSLGEWIFRNACLQNKAWQDQGLKPIRMAINVSGIQLIRENFVDMVELALSDAKLDPKYVEIELTESIIMDDKKKNLTTLMRLNDLGVGLTIDDFGTGYSSLNYLREFPVQKLKIDQSFIHESLTQPKNATIVEAIIAMGHSLKLSVLAEGVETPMQLEFLRNNLCDEVQGYLFGQPMTSQEFSKLLGKIV